MALKPMGQLASMLWGQKAPRLMDMVQATQGMNKPSQIEPPMFNTKPFIQPNNEGANNWGAVLGQFGITPDQVQTLPLWINPGDPNYDRVRDMFGNSTGGLNGIFGGATPWKPTAPAAPKNTGPFDASGKRIRDWQPGDKVYGTGNKKNKK